MKISSIINVTVLVASLSIVSTGFGMLQIMNNTNYTLNFSCPSCLNAKTFSLTPKSSTSVYEQGASGALNIPIYVAAGEQIGPYPKDFSLGTISWEGDSMSGTYCETAAYSLVGLLTGVTTWAGQVDKVPCTLGKIPGYAYANPADASTKALLLATINSN